MTDKEWSTWRIWMHPRMALHYMIDLEIIENEYIRRLLAAESKFVEQREECERLSEEVSRITKRHTECANALKEVQDQLAESRSQCAESRRELDDSRNELAETRMRLDDALSELAEHEDIDLQLEAFGKMLDGVEVMKQNYEKRISELQSRLSGSLVKKSPEPDIEITKLKPEQPKESKEDSDDWLMQLPSDL